MSETEQIDVSTVRGRIERIYKQNLFGWIDFRCLHSDIDAICVNINGVLIDGVWHLNSRPDVSAFLQEDGDFGVQFVLANDIKNLVEISSDEPVMIQLVVRCADGSIVNTGDIFICEVSEWHSFFCDERVTLPEEDASDGFVGAIESLTAACLKGWVASGSLSCESGVIENFFECFVSVWINQSVLIEKQGVAGVRPDVETAIKLKAFAFSLPFRRFEVTRALSRLYLDNKGNMQAPAALSCRVSVQSANDGQYVGWNELVLPQPTPTTLDGWFDFFDIEISEALLSARSPVYEQLLSSLMWTNERAEASREELYATSMLRRRRPRPSTFRNTRAELVERHFDAAYYVSRYGGDLGASVDPLGHYLTVGAAKDFDPHPLFSAKFARKAAGKIGVKPDIDDIFAYYLKYYKFLDFDPHPLFRRKWYKKKYNLPDEENEWSDYADGGWRFGREPNALFLQETVYNSVTFHSEEQSPLELYLTRHECAEIVPHPLLPSTWNRQKYIHLFSDETPKPSSSTLLDTKICCLDRPDIEDNYIRATEYYFSEAEKSGIRPNILFDPQWYRERYGVVSDVRGPLVDYILSGEKIGRCPSSLFHTNLYKTENNDVTLANISPLLHFIIRHRLEHKRRPIYRFASAWFAKNAPADAVSYEDFLTNRLVSAVPPHPALSTLPRSTQVDLIDLLACSPDDPRPMPFGVSTLFAASRQASRGQVMAEIDAYERELADIDPLRVRRLRMDETIVRSCEHFDFRRADEIICMAQQEREPDAPLVSIVIPARNRAGIIGTAIQSVLSQNYDNLEVIVVDDGSTDGTAMAALNTRDTRVHAFTIPPRGVSAARNFGLTKAKGEYVAYLDSDNTWERPYLATMISAMRAKGALLAHAGLRMFTPKGKITYRGEIYDREALDRENYIDMNVFVHHRKVIERGLRFDETLKRCVDWDFIRRACLEIGPSLYVPMIGCNYLDDETLGRITTHEAQGDFFRLCIKQLNLSKHLYGRPRLHRPAYSLIWPLHQEDEARAEVDLWRAIAHLKRSNHELIVVANGLSDKFTIFLDALAKRVDGLRIIQLWRSFLVVPAVMLACRVVQGARVLVWGAHVDYDARQIDCLMRPATPRDCALEFPALVDSNGAFAVSFCAVAADASELIEVLAGQPREDYRFDMQGVLGASTPFVFNVEKVAALGGFDTDFILEHGVLDLALRALRQDASSVVLRGDIDFILARAQAQFGRSDQRTAEARDFARRARPPLGVRPRAIGFASACLAPPARRLAPRDSQLRATPAILPVLSARGRQDGLQIQIRCPAPDDETKKFWGDWHFAQSLSDSFRALGQSPDVRTRTHWQAPSKGFDVALHIRGIVPVVPVPSTFNVMWIISHPEKLTQAEIAAMDVVVACSNHCANEIRHRFGIRCEILPQATDATRFAFREHARWPNLGNRLVFIGNSRRQPRRVVLDAVEIGAKLNVYGGDWSFYVPESCVKGEFVPNNAVADFYRSASAVLNDHWPSMARYGIVSNRLFDVVACGGVAISDEVEGIEDLFGAHVRQCAGSESLKELVDHLAEWVPTLDERREKSREVLADHSFDRRAQQFLDIFDLM
jgi:GT2 family glycosyltransferase